MLLFQIELRKGVKRIRLLRGHVPYQGGGNLPPAKKVDFFRQNVKNTQHALKNYIFIETIFCTGSKEIFIKKEEQSIFCPL